MTVVHVHIAGVSIPLPLAIGSGYGLVAALVLSAIAAVGTALVLELRGKR